MRRAPAPAAHSPAPAPAEHSPAPAPATHAPALTTLARTFTTVVPVAILALFVVPSLHVTVSLSNGTLTVVPNLNATLSLSKGGPTAAIAAETTPFAPSLLVTTRDLLVAAFARDGAPRGVTRILGTPTGVLPFTRTTPRAVTARRNQLALTAATAERPSRRSSTVMRLYP